MCGRVYQTYNPRQLLRLAGTSLIRNQDKHSTGYNMTPTNYIPAIRHHSSAENNNRELDMIKWGYQAPFGQFIVNARVEEAAEKRTFRPLINTARCVMIVQGYFEWTPKKVPFVFHPKAHSKVASGDENDGNDKPPCIYIGGLIAPDDTLILLTRESFTGFDDVHERMPVVLDESEIDMWLDCEKYKFEKILFSEILNEKKEKWSQIGHYETGPLVNNIKNKTDKVIQTLEEYKKDLDKNGIKRFFQAQPKKEKVKEEIPANPQNNKIPEEPKKDIPNDEDLRPTQATQATLAATEEPTQTTQTRNNNNNNPFIEEDECKIGDEESEIEEEKVNNERMEDENINHVQRTLDSTAFGRNGAGFQANQVLVMYKKKEKDEIEEEDGKRSSKKRKEPTNSEELKNDHLKQTKLT